MLARRIVAKHVTKTTALAMFGATAILSGLQVLFTYLGDWVHSMKTIMHGRHCCMYCGVRQIISMKFCLFLP